MGLAQFNRFVSALIAVFMLNIAISPYFAASAQPSSDKQVANCAMMGQMHDGRGNLSKPTQQNLPSPECMVQTGCLVAIGTGISVNKLVDAPVAYKFVNYLSMYAFGSGRDVAPEPLPPRSIA